MDNSRTSAWLEELLEEKSKQLTEAHKKIEDLDRQLRHEVDWMLQTRNEPLDDGLPIPRIEMRVVNLTEWSVETSVLLVLKERDSRAFGAPLAYSKRSGGGLPLKAYATSGALPDHLVSDLPNILNEACFYIEQTSLPGFVVLDADHRYRIESLRPLVLVAVPPSVSTR